MSFTSPISLLSCFDKFPNSQIPKERKLKGEKKEKEG
jgi:hypothetical protein